MEDFALIESNGIRNKDPTRRRASKIFFPLSLFSARNVAYGFLKRFHRQKKRVGRGRIDKPIDRLWSLQKGPQCPRSRPCIGNCIVAACRRLSRLSLLGINARTRALQVFSRKEQSSRPCLGSRTHLGCGKRISAIGERVEREKEALVSLPSSSARIFLWSEKKAYLETFLTYDRRRRDGLCTEKKSKWSKDIIIYGLIFKDQSHFSSSRNNFIDR